MRSQFSNEPDRRLLSILRPFEVAALILVFVTASIILLLWFVPPLDALAPPVWSRMTANSAVGMFCAACCLSYNPKAYWPKLLFRQIAAGIVLAIGLLTISEYIGHIDIGIDRWLPHARVALFPGRPSPQSAFGFVLLGVCLLTMNNKSGRQRLADGAALALVAFVLVMLGWHVYGAVGLDGVNKVTVLSPQTLLAFCCLAFLIVLRRAKSGQLLAVLVNIGIGSRLVRIAMPMVILLPLFSFAAEDYVIESKLLTAPFAHAGASAVASFLILCVIIWLGRMLNRFERQIRNVSLTDELTGIYNRRGFYFLGHQAVLDARRAGTGLTIFFFDLDGLKQINDGFGHEEGSDFIRAFASVLVKTFRESDIVGRIGGDEFAVLNVREDDTQQEALALLAHNVAEYNRAGARVFTLRYSAGYAQLNIKGRDSLDAMVIRADAMMYREKARKRTIDVAA